MNAKIARCFKRYTPDYQCAYGHITKVKFTRNVIARITLVRHSAEFVTNNDGKSQKLREMLKIVLERTMRREIQNDLPNANNENAINI